MLSRKLSKRVKFYEEPHQNRVAGWLYYRMHMTNGRTFVAGVKASQRMRSWWGFHILARTDAVRVDEMM